MANYCGIILFDSKRGTQQYAHIHIHAMYKHMQHTCIQYIGTCTHTYKQCINTHGHTLNSIKCIEENLYLLFLSTFLLLLFLEK